VRSRRWVSCEPRRASPIRLPSLESVLAGDNRHQPNSAQRWRSSQATDREPIEIMTYGQKVNDSRLFPVEITTIERTPDGHIKLVLAHSSSALGGATTTGHIILRTDEAAALGDELLGMSRPDHPHGDDGLRSSSRHAS
jgi:hypothetical protein